MPGQPSVYMAQPGLFILHYRICLFPPVSEPLFTCGCLFGCLFACFKIHTSPLTSRCDAGPSRYGAQSLRPPSACPRQLRTPRFVCSLTARSPLWPALQWRSDPALHPLPPRSDGLLLLLLDVGGVPPLPPGPGRPPPAPGREDPLQGLQRRASAVRLVRRLPQAVRRLLLRQVSDLGLRRSLPLRRLRQLSQGPARAPPLPQPGRR